MRQDRYNTEGKHHKRENGKHTKASSKNGRRNKKADQRRAGRRKRIILIIVIIIIVGGVAAEMFILARMNTADQRFLRSAERGVIAGWELDKNELQLRDSGRISDISFIETELGYVNDYRNKIYEDEEIGKLAREYIAALRACRKAYKAQDPSVDFTAFWSMFSEPYGRRVAALRALQNGEYRFSLEKEGYGEEFDNLMLQGWAVEKLSDLNFEMQQHGSGSYVFTADVTNDSGYRIDYLNLDLSIYNKKGKITEHVSAFAEKISRGENVTLTFYHVGSRPAAYSIDGITCRQKMPGGK